jgi:hypothetical protein
MRRIVNAANNGSVVLVERDGTYFQVDVVWPDAAERGELIPETGTQMVFPYENLDLAWKWGPWESGIAYDEELPPPPEIEALVDKALEDYDAKRGYTP